MDNDLQNSKKRKSKSNSFIVKSSLLPAKKKKLLISIPPSPFGIQPWGNLLMKYLSGSNNLVDSRTSGLGHMAVLEDQQLIEQILIFLTASELSSISCVSRALYIYSHYDDLWKELVMDYWGGNWSFKTSWKITYINAYLASLHHLNPLTSTMNHHIDIIKSDHFYSDFLYEEYQSTEVDLNIWSTLKENIQRASHLSLVEFNDQFANPNIPVILTDQIIGKWPAMERWTDKNWWIETFPAGKTFQVGRVEMNIENYFDYCMNTHEERPLYLFDNLFGEKYPELLNDFQIPIYFQQDFFALLPSDVRPSYRWILIGPPKSGSCFHKDPNSTSAWNGLLKGRKLWILFPPDYPPPGVFPSADEYEVTTPVSVIEWMLRFFPELNDLEDEKGSTRNSAKAQKQKIKPIIGYQNPGDLIFIPNGWWHQVLNLEECVAVTQNVVCEANLLNVVKFLKGKRKPDVWNSFEAAMKQNFPILLEQAESQIPKPRRFEISSAAEDEDALKEFAKKDTSFSFSALFKQRTVNGQIP